MTSPTDVIPEPAYEPLNLDSLEMLIPASHLVLEGIAPDIDTLIGRVGDDEIFLDSIGRRCVTGARARSLFSERAAAEAQRRAQIKQEIAEQRELSAQQRAEREAKLQARKRQMADGDTGFRYNP